MNSEFAGQLQKKWMMENVLWNQELLFELKTSLGMQKNERFANLTRNTHDSF